MLATFLFIKNKVFINLSFPSCSLDFINYFCELRLKICF